MWDNCYSEYFGAENGVRQGGVASPFLFTVYLDELLVRLEKTNVGCYISHEWYGGFGYVDDMELQCPSIKGLHQLVSTCTEFGREYGVTYNSIMSMCIAFCKGKARNVEEMPRIYLEDQALSWVLRVKFLGLHINYDLKEDIRIRLKQSDFIGRVNSLMYSFRYTTRRVLTLRLDSKCSHYYGCEAWDLKQSQAIHRFSVSWNKAMRRVWCLPSDSHRSILAGLNNSKHAIDKIYANQL